ncbi:MAG TPA: phosphoenolpyruvate--protein phosphotransferase [Syntrophobacteraceae bacterium]|nr:phosphoenolpyruvate--protein phosphotransferase [Syntrophobacteraceae bacterium]HBZ54441.1 phosphoenolpyruvate--protein phosphotransferase [Syntrophobacteraceae bacterium]
MRLSSTMDHPSRVIHGVGASPGIAIGKAYVLKHDRVPIPHYTLGDEQAIEAECQRFEAAVAQAELQLEEIKSRIHPDFKEHAHILDAHQLILRDRLIYDETLRFIREERLNAQWAIIRSLFRAHELFDVIDDDYIKSRVADIDYVGERVLRNLAGSKLGNLNAIRERVIIVAHDLSPADTAQLQVERTMGLVTDMGGRTSHTSIIARSLNIPTVVGAEVSTRLIEAGDILILDGASGKVIVNPSEEELSYFYERQDELEGYLKEISRKSHLPARTLDGYEVMVEANMELLEEVVAVKDNGAEGIGLYRTEFLFMNCADLPGEETLYHDYREIAEIMAPQRVTFRTLDLGAEKLSAWYPTIEQANPALGLRAIRLCLRYQELFQMQLRAILRASAEARNINIMFPLISGIAELRAARAVLRDVQTDLQAKRIPFDEHMPVGIMMEIPSAVAVADLLAREVDFFSIGTNDLIQYTLAIDRVNEHVAYLYDPLDPAVLRFIKTIVDAGHRAGIPVSICGEMAGEPLYIPLLLGFQLDSLSMNPQAVPRVKNLIRRSRAAECTGFLKRALDMATAREISEVLQALVLEKFPEEFRFFDPSALNPDRSRSATKRSSTHNHPLH